MLGRQSAPLVEVPQSTHTRQHLSSPSPTIMMDEFLSCDKKKDNFYDILGCDPMSSVEQIQAEYKVRALQLHPDKNPDNPEAEGQFQMLQVAKDTLSDPEKRAQYDRWLNSGITISYDKWCGMKQHMTTEGFLSQIIPCIWLPAPSSITLHLLELNCKCLAPASVFLFHLWLFQSPVS
ncbi:J domain-containing protein isoform X2 [Procambarus clarkii]|uniref:J domain-containing protein isoform X2 n=1 Tax=Procambarus clarkii TaxID=6728 RepID=UPI003742CC12